MIKPIIISFYTNDWEYPVHAARLKLECIKLGFEHCIEERPSTKDYIQNTAIKPFFIKECLEKFKQPVLWIDVDALILKKFNITVGDEDILACKYTNTTLLKREWAVAFLGFNYTENSLKFLETWCHLTQNKTDEAGFENAWEEAKSFIKIKTLPETFHFIKWRDNLEVPEGTIICHQLSKFEDKLKRKNKQNGLIKDD
jgi:hypothetical protein